MKQKMNPRDFKEDLEKSNNPKIRACWEKIIKNKFDCDITWEDASNVQKGMGIDLVIKTKKGRRYSIEVKSRNNSTLGKDWIMEIVHHIYDREDDETRKHLYSKEGWVYNSTAEYILHGTLNKEDSGIVEAIFYSLVTFKTPKYKSEFKKYKTLWLPTKYPNGKFQLTLNKLIPKEVIKRDASEFWEWEE